HSHQTCKHAPEKGPIHSAPPLRSMKPPAGAQIPDDVAETARHDHIQRLGARAPRRVDPLIEVNLRGDKKERERESMQGDTGQHPGLEVHRVKAVADQSKANSDGEGPFESPS